ncbi:hypothetical protein ANCDUO_13887 [Ancylostoma duodenale]|uniref:Transposase IS30-like HTH domain-containing protein n=1 Tax=Ancylostoma duodenale TaxID=51022 RepID=A0A0C2D1P8_9BILA|nr:hypothetical protein ANCDUO_13887 [Ancylostoma duodenale]
MSPPGRAAILSLGKNGHSVSEIARLLKLHRETVRRTLKRGTLEDIPRSGRPVSSATSRLKKIVAKRIERNSARSMRKMATDLNVSERTMRRVVHGQLRMFPYKFQKKHGLIKTQKKGRREKCVGLLTRAERGEYLLTLFFLMKNYSRWSSAQIGRIPGYSRITAKKPKKPGGLLRVACTRPQSWFVQACLLRVEHLWYSSKKELK